MKKIIFGRFLNERLFKTMVKKLLFIALVMLAFGSMRAQAQVQDPNSPGYDYSYTDSTATASDSTQQSTEEAQNAGPSVKPYQRIVLNMDSTTNLITYSGVVEQEESGVDSLYIRARRFAEKNFGKSKEVFESEKRNQKLVVVGTIPAYAYINKYNKRSIGKYEFKMTILVKEGRYKYVISNLVHEGQQPAQGKSSRNYFEYYYTSNTNVQAFDRILRYADFDIQQTIKKFELAMKEPKLVDEDDW